MRKFLIFIVVAAASGALVWHFAPHVGAKLPPEMRTQICSAVDFTTDSVTALFKGTMESEKKDSAPQHDDGAQQGERGAAQEGRVRPVDVADATWGVLNRITPVEELDGKPIGNVQGGKFFLIKGTISTPDGLKVSGTFDSTNLTRSVRIPADSLYCFSGTPGLLSTNQQTNLSKYFQLTGEAEALKTKLKLDAGSSPYLKDAADALRQLRALEKSAAERKATADADTLRKLTYEVSQLRAKVQELNKKHKDWKAAHPAEAPVPEKDPAYIKILRRREKYVEPIKNLLP